jgi:hypothetical protein
LSVYLDELKAAVEAEFAANKAAQTLTEPDPEPVAPVEQPEPIVEPVTPEPAEDQPVPADALPEPNPERKRREVYVKTVDLGDGSQPQTFKAATKDELIEKILKAQENASRRIKALKEENRKLMQSVQPDAAAPVKSFEPQTLTPEQELELINELQTNPTEGLKKALKAVLGQDAEEIRKDLSDLRSIRQKEAVKAIGQEFINAHPEYPITNANEKLMGEYIQKNKLGWTVKNLELAFADLQEAGLVTVASAPTLPNEELESEVEVPAEPVTPPAVAVPVVPVATPTTSVRDVPRKRTVVGVSTSQSAPAVPATETQREVSVDDFLKLPSSERRRIVMREVAR